jgi:hypothetical protein
LREEAKHVASGTIAGASSLAGTTDAKQLLFCAKDAVQVWSIAEAKLSREIEVPGPVACAVSEDGVSLAIACADSVVRGL